MIALEDQEQICAECLKREPTTLLCSGLRPTFDSEFSEEFGVLRINDVACEKLLECKMGADLASRRSQTMIPKKAIEETLNRGLPCVEFEQEGTFLLEGRAFDSPVFGYTNLEHTKQSFRLMLGVVEAGGRAKFVYPQAWYPHVRQWEEKGFQEIHSVDLVAVDHIDGRGGTDFARGELFAALQNRVASCLPTIITISQQPVGRNDSENEFFRDIQTWQRSELRF